VRAIRIKGLKDYRIGGLEDWRIGGLEDWRIGGLEDEGRNCKRQKTHNK
jgi:hypothetical protein